MKVKLLLPTLLIPLFLVAQDDYCSCMETDNSYEELFTSLTQYKEELTLWQRQTTTITRTKIVIPPTQEVTQTLVEEAFIEEQKKEVEESQTNIPEKEKDELDELENNVDDALEKSLSEKSERDRRVSKIKGKSKRAKGRIKSKQKRLKVKLKRKRKVRKYRGACPNF